MAVQPDRFTVKSQEAVATAQRLAAERRNPEVAPAHLLLALLDQEDGLVVPVLQKVGADVDQIRARTLEAADNLPELGGVRLEDVVVVTAKGNRGQAIFGDDLDRHRFLAIVDDAATRHRWRCGAYCLMSNHFHVLVQTPAAAEDLAAGMHRLNGRYAQRFNDRYGLEGHLFQGRFHSVLTESEGHLLEVVRYIFLNPVRANVCPSPAAWPWSSFRATLGRAPAPPFLSDEMVLELFGPDRKRGRARLASFVSEG